jgi:hypothetical protein
VLSTSRIAQLALEPPRGRQPWLPSLPPLPVAESISAFLGLRAQRARVYPAARHIQRRYKAGEPHPPQHPTGARSWGGWATPGSTVARNPSGDSSLRDRSRETIRGFGFTRSRDRGLSPPQRLTQIPAQNSNTARDPFAPSAPDPKFPITYRAMHWFCTIGVVPDFHSEFSELSAVHPESRSFLREISTDFRLTQRLHLKWNPST